MSFTKGEAEGIARRWRRDASMAPNETEAWVWAEIARELYEIVQSEIDVFAQEWNEIEARG